MVGGGIGGGHTACTRRHMVQRCTRYRGVHGTRRHTERACTPSPLRLNDAAPAVDVTVVLARYEEDVSWILSYPKVRFAIYNKGPELPAAVLAHGRLEVVAKPNRGREGVSYIDYVRDHYDALPAVVVFSQAAPTDKVPDFYAFLDDVLDGSLRVDGYVPAGTLKFVPRWMAGHPAHGLVQMYHTLFAADWKYDLFFPHGATMACSGEAVRARSATFWQVAHHLVDHDHGGVAAHPGTSARARARWSTSPVPVPPIGTGLACRLGQQQR